MILTLISVHNRTSLMLCIVGGLSMIVSGITSTLEYLPALREGINEVLSYS
jgi:hypothetical protein